MRSFIGFALATLPLSLATVWQVDVGPNGQLTYYPEYVLAEVGDQVQFNFQPKNHTVTQSSFDQPCVPLANGFNSGFEPTAANATEKPTFVVTVNNTNPSWVYCAQTGHCGAGMVFAINPPDASSNHSFAAFKALAIATNGTAAASVPYSTPPPQSWATATATIANAASTFLTTYTSYQGSPQPTYAPSGPVTHNITVGFDGQLAFGPQPNITAAIGDIVSFTFLAKNHSVQQSIFSNPCVQLETGFNLGFHPVAANTTGPTLSITVNDTAPIWGFCGQTGHCGSGMVFSINAVESGPNNFEAFQSLAERINGTTTNGAAASAGSGSGTASGSSPSGSSSGSGQNGAVSGRRASGVVVALGLVVAVGAAYV